jgi:hypothetical protein
VASSLQLASANSSKARFAPQVALFWFGLAGVFYAQILPPQIGCVVAFAAVMTTVYRRSEDYIPYAELAASIATLQWVFAPMLSYAFSSHFKYYMYVDADAYFGFAIPATCAMNGALLSFRRAPELSGTSFKLEYSPVILRNISVFLIVVGTLSRYAANYAPQSLAFVFFLLSQLPNVAVLILIYHRVPRTSVLLLFALTPLFFSAGATAMFHSLLLWGAFIGFYWLRAKKRSPGIKCTMFWLGAFAVLFVQFLKSNYREELRQNPEMSRVQALSNVASLDLFAQGDNWEGAIIRFNQGWIISAVMAHVPRVEPYADGETIADAAIASVFPRFVYQDKTRAGGQGNFVRFTGLEIGENTSMGISPLGEAYANFGRNGGIVTMFVWGGLFAWFIQFLERFALRRPLFHFLVSLILYQGLKAETEFLIIFNQFTKGFVLALIIYWGIEIFGKVRSLRRTRALQRQIFPSRG